MARWGAKAMKSSPRGLRGGLAAGALPTLGAYDSGGVPMRSMTILGVFGLFMPPVRIERGSQVVTMDAIAGGDHVRVQAP